MKMRSMMTYRILVVLLFLVVSSASKDFMDDCSVCECKWLSGQKAAICSNRGLPSIPDSLHSEIQSLNLDDNPIYEIPIAAFKNTRLTNVQKLLLKNCKLQQIHKDAFIELTILIEMDLSFNDLTTLHRDTFSHMVKLRIINLNNNRLRELPDGLFDDFNFLQTIQLAHNHIHKIGLKTFSNLPNIKVIKLNENNMTHLSEEALSSLTNLTGLVLHENPWNCDCSLRKFRDWVIKRNFYTSPTSCDSPLKYKNRLWSDLASTDFACKPNVVYPSHGTTVEFRTGDNATLACKVVGNPLPEVNWKQGARIIDGNAMRHGDHRFVVEESDNNSPRWVNLTIINVKFHDRGEYVCVAKSPGGEEETAITLTVNKNAVVSGTGFGSAEAMSLYIGLAAGLIVLMVIVAFLFYCFCKRRNSKRRAKSDMHSSNGEALIEGSVIPEMEKSLITTVNPVTKPPRRYDAPMSITSGATEMSEMNKTLLDNESVYGAGNDNENKSIEYADIQAKQPRNAMSADSIRMESKTYPPDLLSFPVRGGQVSPAASTASTAPDSSRLPPQVHSPLHSPVYSANPNLFKTLPYSRSQSPFTTTPCPPVIAPRQGYVTIPRRPRVPSWSSTASSVMSPMLPPTPGGEIVEPVYDNLGLRTTADGSSVLSLNKAGLDAPQYPSTMKGRPLPATPTSYHASQMYAPIEEHELAASSTPKISYSSTLPRHHSPSVAEPQEPIYPRSFKLTNGRLYDSISSNGTVGRSGKVPPRPPPKPAKKSPSRSNGPLFEDEGEDGTEV